MTEYCAVIGPALYKASQQTALKEVTTPLPSLAEWGMAMQDYNLCSLPTGLANRCIVFIVQRSLCKISGKNSYTPYLTMLGATSSVAKFDKVCTQFEERPALHLAR